VEHLLMSALQVLKLGTQSKMLLQLRNLLPPTLVLPKQK
jgi:hypothetical protein